MNESMPLLYSFRRCPYAMRARMALILCQIQVQVQEISLKAKPAGLLAANPKGTVPVLVKPGNEVISESLDIMRWAIEVSQDSAIRGQLTHQQEQALTLITANDIDFKPWLDKYKYFDRYPEASQQDYRDKGCEFLDLLEQRLAQTPWLLGDKPSLADIAIFPFIRQFAAVDPDWFASAPYPALRLWLDNWLAHPAFTACMYKYPELGEPVILKLAD